MSKEIDIQDFAIRVERLCDFFIDKAMSEPGHGETHDLKVIKDLKETATDIQFDHTIIGSKTLFGLDDYMRGHLVKAEDKKE